MSNEHGWATAELVVTVALPAIALIFLTDADRLGPTWGLVVALVPPILWGIGSMVRLGQVSALAVLAMVSVLLTGGVGLLRLDPEWFAVKEAAVPVLVGLGTIASAGTRFDVMTVLLDRLFDLDKVQAAAATHQQAVPWSHAVARATRLAGGVLIATAGITYALARFMVRSETGTEAFGDELGQYTLVSLPALMVPSTAGMMWVLTRLLDAMERATGEDRETFMR